MFKSLRQATDQETKGAFKVAVALKWGLMNQIEGSA
jgi:hypothetical protein